MIKKIEVRELREGMYVCGVEKAGAGAPDFFMNSILVKNGKDLEGFAKSGHRCVYVEIKEDAPAAPAPEQAPGHAIGQAIEQADRGLDPFSAFQSFEPPGDEAEGFAELTKPAEEHPLEGNPLEANPVPPPARLEPLAPFLSSEEDAYLGNACEPLASGPGCAPEEEIAEIEAVEEEARNTEPEAKPSAPVEACSTEAVDPVAPLPQKSPKAAQEQAFGIPAPGYQVRDTVAFEEELVEAKDIRNEAEGLVRDFMGRVRIDGGIQTDKVNRTVGRMVDSVFKNQDALASLSRLKSRDDYTFAHCVNVCILSLALGRHMGFTEGELNELGTGAILHDIGKMLVPENILKKPGRLTEDELGLMQRHTALGGEILSKTSDISDSARSVPLHHHEKFDGSGYLDRLRGAGIHIYARIAAVADVYDAMTSDRVYQKGMHPEVALRRMYQLRGVSFEPEIVERLIKCLGIYPIGTFVQLNTGEMAVVSMPNHTDPLKPKVLVLYDRSRRRLPRPVDIDLKTEGERWITASKDPGPLAGFLEKLIA